MLIAQHDHLERASAGSGNEPLLFQHLAELIESDDLVDEQIEIARLRFRFGRLAKSAVRNSCRTPMTEHFPRGSLGISERTCWRHSVREHMCVHACSSSGSRAELWVDRRVLCEQIHEHLRNLHASFRRKRARVYWRFCAFLVRVIPTGTPFVCETEDF